MDFYRKKYEILKFSGLPQSSHSNQANIETYRKEILENYKLAQESDKDSSSLNNFNFDCK